MTCRYCRAQNGDQEHRCQRCGRRLHVAGARPAPDTYPLATSSSLALEALPRSEHADQTPEPVAIEAPRPRTQPRRGAYQPSLFRDMQTVIAMPEPPSSPRRASARASRQPAPRQSLNQSSLTKASPAPAFAGVQQSLEFMEGVSPWSSRTPVETAIFCDAPVASPVHRLIAASLDASMIIMAMGLFLLTFYLAGGEMSFDRQTIPLLVGIAAVFGLFYHFLFCIGNGDTPGMRWTQLRLLNFDGQKPHREQRTHRLLFSCLSLISAGLGIIWAVVDEERLTWHDHMSKTFPSPYGEPVTHPIHAKPVSRLQAEVH